MERVLVLLLIGILLGLIVDAVLRFPRSSRSVVVVVPESDSRRGGGCGALLVTSFLFVLVTLALMA